MTRAPSTCPGVSWPPDGRPRTSLLRAFSASHRPNWEEILFLKCLLSRWWCSFGRDSDQHSSQLTYTQEETTLDLGHHHDNLITFSLLLCSLSLSPISSSQAATFFTYLRLVPLHHPLESSLPTRKNVLVVPWCVGLGPAKEPSPIYLTWEWVCSWQQVRAAESRREANNCQDMCGSLDNWGTVSFSLVSEGCQLCCLILHCTALFCNSFIWTDKYSNIYKC